MLLKLGHRGVGKVVYKYISFADIIHQQPLNAISCRVGKNSLQQGRESRYRGGTQTETQPMIKLKYEVDYTLCPDTAVLRGDSS